MLDYTKQRLEKFIKGEIKEFCVDLVEFDEVVERLEDTDINYYTDQDTPADVIFSRA